MPGMESYSKAATERAMKVQEVILRAAAKKKITWWQAIAFYSVLTCPSPGISCQAVTELNVYKLSF